jgi:hypothetical protein
VFEYNCNLKGINCFYPIETEQMKTIDVGWDKPYIYFGNDSEGIPICKLHGSVNLFQKNDDIFIANRISNGEVIGRSRLKKEWRAPAIFAVDAIEYIKQHYPYLSPAVIPPTYAKLKQHKWLKSIWNAAFNAVVDAKKIIFIGYSMPPSDGFMKSFFVGALALRKMYEKPKIFIIDKETATIKRYQDVFGALLCNSDAMTLQESIKNGRLIYFLKS